MYKYFVFEGIHGSGKKTLALKFLERLIANGFYAKYLHFPNEEDKLGQAIREVLTDPDLYKNREVTGLMYAAASNIFHIKSKDDDKIYVLERDSVTTGLIFQKDIPFETRKQIYKFGIENLKNNGIMIYIQIDPKIAFERLQSRNKLLAKKGGVWKDKSKDNFINKDFLDLAEKYDKFLVKRTEELRIPTIKISNNGTLEEAVDEMVEKLILCKVN